MSSPAPSSRTADSSAAAATPAHAASASASPSLRASAALVSASVTAPATDPHRESRERAERLLGWVGRELNTHPSPSAPSSVGAALRPTVPFTHGLRA
jgi:hypothetical protein